jgi:hypothetical protein
MEKLCLNYIQINKKYLKYLQDISLLKDTSYCEQVLDGYPGIVYL